MEATHRAPTFEKAIDLQLSNSDGGMGGFLSARTGRGLLARIISLGAAPSSPEARGVASPRKLCTFDVSSEAFGG